MKGEHDRPGPQSRFPLGTDYTVFDRGGTSEIAYQATCGLDVVVG